jgi:hypothetical protein
MTAKTMPKITIRAACAADFTQLLAEPLPYRVRAFAGERGGELLGVGGLAFQPDGAVAAFLILTKDESGHAPARRYKVALHKAGLRVLAEARRLRIRRVVALAEQHNEAAEPWLTRLGFQPLVRGGETAWVWTNEDEEERGNE